MQSQATTVNEYINELPEERKNAISNLRDIVNTHIPDWFEEGMWYGMMGRDVPLTKFPQGYHCNPTQPLPFVGIASQKNNISLYHMGIYSKPELLERFITEYPKYSTKKLDMGKSCIRRKKESDIPYDLIGELMSKITVEEWIHIYQDTLDTRNKLWKKS